MHSSLHALPVLQDNVIWIWVRGAEAVVIDPAVAPPVREWLDERQLSLTAVLQTHHHADHIGGTQELLKRWPEAAVIASAEDRERIPFQTMPVRDGDQITVLGHEVEVLDVAAHTRAHIAFSSRTRRAAKSGPCCSAGTPCSAGAVADCLKAALNRCIRSCRSWRNCPRPQAFVVPTSTPRPTCNGPWSNAPATQFWLSATGRCGGSVPKESSACPAASAWNAAPTCSCRRVQPRSWPSCVSTRTSGGRHERWRNEGITNGDDRGDCR